MKSGSQTWQSVKVTTILQSPLACLWEQVIETSESLATSSQNKVIVHTLVAILAMAATKSLFVQPTLQVSRRTLPSSTLFCNRGTWIPQSFHVTPIWTLTSTCDARMVPLSSPFNIHRTLRNLQDWKIVGILCSVDSRFKIQDHIL